MLRVTSRPIWQTVSLIPTLLSPTQRVAKVAIESRAFATPLKRCLKQRVHHPSPFTTLHSKLFSNSSGSRVVFEKPVEVENGFPPMLKDAASRMDPNLCLKKTSLVIVGHLTPTNAMFIRMLVQKFNLKEENVFFQPKCYSINETSYRTLQELGVFVAETGFAFDPSKNYETVLRPAAVETLKYALSKIAQREDVDQVMLMDEGAFITDPSILGPLLEMLPKRQIVIGSELTGGGIHKLAGKKIPIPIINMADSPIKKNEESKIIVATMLPIVHRTVKKFLQIQPLSNKFKPQILIHGKGSIGSLIEASIKDMYETKTYDQDPSRTSYGEDEFDEALEWADIHIVAHPGETLTQEQREKLKNCAIINVGSGNEALGVYHLLEEHFKTHSLPKSCHEDVYLEKQNILIANQGYPINFTTNPREYNWVEHHLTRMIQLMAIIQAMNNPPSEKKLVPLSPHLIRIGLRLWQEYRGKL